MSPDDHVKLRIDDPVLVVPRTIGTAQTRVRYRSTSNTMTVAGADRMGAGTPWTPIDLRYVTSTTVGGHAQDPEFDGDFLSPKLKPGEAYEVKAWWADETTDMDPIVTVIALAEEPSRTAIFTDKNEEAHGTFFDLHLHGSRAHRLFVQAGYSTPVRDSPSLPAHIPSASVTVFDTSSATDHTVHLEGGLRAGSTVQWLARAIDSIGDWHEWIGQITLKQRTVTLHLDKIVVVNDSDPSSTGEADFSVEVYEGSSLVHSLGFYDGDVDDGESIGLPVGGTPPWTAKIGPHEVLPGEEVVRVHPSGLEHDGFLESDEPADSYKIEKEVLTIPEGTGETVVAAPVTVTAGPIRQGDDFIFRVEGTYDVTYT